MSKYRRTQKLAGKRVRYLRNSYDDLVRAATRLARYINQRVYINKPEYAGVRVIGDYELSLRPADPTSYTYVEPSGQYVTGCSWQPID